MDNLFTDVTKVDDKDLFSGIEWKSEDSLVGFSSEEDEFKGISDNSIFDELDL